MSEKSPLFLCPLRVSLGKCESTPSLLGGSLSESALFAAVSFTFLRELFANWALIATFAVKIRVQCRTAPVARKRSEGRCEDKPSQAREFPAGAQRTDRFRSLPEEVKFKQPYHILPTS